MNRTRAEARKLKPRGRFTSVVKTKTQDQQGKSAKTEVLDRLNYKLKLSGYHTNSSLEQALQGDQKAPVLRILANFLHATEEADFVTEVLDVFAKQLPGSSSDIAPLVMQKREELIDEFRAADSAQDSQYRVLINTIDQWLRANEKALGIKAPSQEEPVINYKSSQESLPEEKKPANRFLDFSYGIPAQFLEKLNKEQALRREKEKPALDFVNKLLVNGHLIDKPFANLLQAFKSEHSAKVVQILAKRSASNKQVASSLVAAILMNYYQFEKKEIYSALTAIRAKLHKNMEMISSSRAALIPRGPKRDKYWQFKNLINKLDQFLDLKANLDAKVLFPEPDSPERRAKLYANGTGFNPVNGGPKSDRWLNLNLDFDYQQD